jgi:hypothetical protein
MTEQLELVPNAAEKLQYVDSLVEELAKTEAAQEARYVSLGRALLEVQQNQYWRGQHASWTAYKLALCEKYKMGQTQMQAYCDVVKALDGKVSEAELNAMGISKAKELRQIVRKTGDLPEGAIEAATDSNNTTKDLKRILYDKTGLPQNELQDWIDLDLSGYDTTENRATVAAAYQAALRTHPILPPGSSKAAQDKDVRTKWAMEYLSAHSPQAEEESL